MVTKPNIPLLRKMVEWCEEQEARTEDREWYQEYWITDMTTHLRSVVPGFCSTAYCVAGKVATDAGWKPVWFEWQSGETDAQHVTRDGRTLTVQKAAAELLGLQPEATDRLFDSENSAGTIRQIAEDIAGERL